MGIMLFRFVVLLGSLLLITIWTNMGSRLLVIDITVPQFSMFPKPLDFLKMNNCMSPYLDLDLSYLSNSSVKWRDKENNVCVRACYSDNL